MLCHVLTHRAQVLQLTSPAPDAHLEIPTFHEGATRVQMKARMRGLYVASCCADMPVTFLQMHSALPQPGWMGAVPVHGLRRAHHTRPLMDCHIAVPLRRMMHGLQADRGVSR